MANDNDSNVCLVIVEKTEPWAIACNWLTMFCAIR